MIGKSGARRLATRLGPLRLPCSGGRSPTVDLVFDGRKAVRRRGLLTPAERARLPNSHSVPRDLFMRMISLLLSATGAVACFAQSPHPVQSASPMQSADAGARELLPDEQIQQVLNRLTFGARPGDAATVRALGVDKWIDLQLHPDRIDDPAVAQLMKSYSVFSLPTSTIVRDYTEVQRLQRQAKRADAKDSSM